MQRFDRKSFEVVGSEDGVNNGWPGSRGWPRAKGVIKEE